MSNLILASKSPYRKQLLEKLGVSFKCVDSGFDETPLKKLNIEFIELSQKLAKAKALSVLTNFPDSIIIGSDQVCCLDKMRLSKAGTKEKAIEQLSLLSGRTHYLHTSYCLLSKDKELIRTVSTELKLKNLSETQIKKYVDQDNPIDCAGSYKLEEHGISLMESVKTSDHTAIIGLPLIGLSKDLAEFGIITP